MPLMYQENSLQMEWCLNCHREPEKFLRPKEYVFNMTYQAPDGSEKNAKEWKNHKYMTQAELGASLAKEYHLRSTRDITSCSTCHR
jgi:hypothetical protein